MARPITHKSWFGQANIQQWLDASTVPLTGRFAVGPHAGYTFCGKVLAHTYSSLDPSVTTIFVLGPCHVRSFDGVRSTSFEAYASPWGSVQVSPIAKEFTAMDQATDLKEHAIVMHVPFLQRTHPGASIVPLVWGGRDTHAVTPQLQKYLSDPTIGFVVSTDFCHWGEPFGYQAYSSAPGRPLRHVLDGRIKRTISESIEELDRAGMDVASQGSAKEWKKYIRKTGNTVCGAQPLEALLAAAEAEGQPLRLRWLAYAQSSTVVDPDDMSVSYAAAVSE